MLDLLIVPIFDLHEALELMLVPFELLLKPNNSHILCKFCILFLRLSLEELELLLNFVHVSLECKPEVILVLAEHIDQLLIVGIESARYLLKRALHLPNVVLKLVNHRVRTFVSIAEIFLHVLDKRFKNYKKNQVS